MKMEKFVYSVGIALFFSGIIGIYFGFKISFMLFAVISLFILMMGMLFIKKGYINQKYRFTKQQRFLDTLFSIDGLIGVLLFLFYTYLSYVLIPSMLF